MNATKKDKDNVLWTGGPAQRKFYCDGCSKWHQGGDVWYPANASMPGITTEMFCGETLLKSKYFSVEDGN